MSRTRQLDRYLTLPRRRLWAACLLFGALACSEAPPKQGSEGKAGSGGSPSNAGTSGGAGSASAGGTSSGGMSARGGSGGSSGSGSAGSAGTSAGAGSGGAGRASGGAAGSVERGGASGSGGTDAAAGRSGGGASMGGQGAGAGGTAGADSAGGGAAGSAGGGSGAVSLLLFSRTAGFRHDSIPTGIAALSELAEERGWTLTATEDPSLFNDGELATRDAVVFLSTTGDALDDAQQAAFERFIRAGGGFIGIHAASDTEFDWPFFGGLVGAYFSEHPAIQQASVVVEDPSHPSTLGLPDPWRRTDEWYSFRTNPRRDVQVLLTLDESSYSPGETAMGSDHPIAWCHTYEGGRSFYTALGHTSESYSEPLFLSHVAGGIEWVLGP